MCALDNDELISDRVTRLDKVRAWRDMMRFESLSVSEQWADIEQSWPPPFAEGIGTHPEIRLIHTELSNANASIQAMLTGWDALKAELECGNTDDQALTTAENVNRQIDLAEAMLRISVVTHDVVQCQQRIEQINATSEVTRQLVERETRERYRLAHDTLTKKIRLALTGSQAHPAIVNETLDADILLLRFKLLALKLEATETAVHGLSLSDNPLFKSILADYVHGTRDTRTQILYLLRTHMLADAEVFGRMRDALGPCADDPMPAGNDED
jgi:hypothetical protein